jgi:hypothetical protein
MIRPFLVSGVLEQEYDGERTRAGFTQRLEDAFRQADSVAGKDPAYKELDLFTLSGVAGQWRFCSAPSPQYADGRYYVMEKLALTPIYAVLETDAAQTISVRFNAKRVCVWLNGRIVLNNDDIHTRKHERVYVFEHAVKPNYETARIDLNAGENRLFVLQGAVGRGTGMSFSMELLDCERPVIARIPLSTDAAIREEIARSQIETHMIDDCWKSGETPIIHVGRVPAANFDVTLQLLKPDSVIQDIVVEQADVMLGGGLDAGHYTVNVQWRMKDGTLLSDASLGFTVADIVAPLPGYDNFPTRRARMLRRLADKGDLLALYRLERYGEITLERVEGTCGRIDRLADCADFDLLPLLWLAWEDREARRIGDDALGRIRSAAVGFRYWVDEPGVSSMFYCSENHRVGFHVCEYLAGLLYPAETFTNVGQNGMYHSLKGRMHLIEWLSQRCRAGFDEPHSDSYLPVTMSALLALREVLPMEEYPLRNMTDILLDFMTYIFAVSSFDGVMAVPRGRSYNKPLRSGLMSKIGGVFWLMFGNCEANAEAMNPELAFSYYTPPRGLCGLADNFAPAVFHFKQGIMHFDKHNADFTIRRTKDYMIGGVRDHNVGMCDMHFISSMIALRGDATVFFSAPHNVAEGSGLRPDYWAGQAFLPRVLIAGRTLAVVWHNVGDPNIWMTHCHFNARKFDEVIARDGWTFGRKADGYVAIHSSSPHAVGAEGLYAGRELVSDGNEVVWLAECGSKDEDGGFEAFIKKIASAARWQDDDGYHFASPFSGLVEFGLDEGFTVDRKAVPIPEYMALSPYVKSRFGSGRIQYTVPGFEVEKWSYAMCE